MHSEVRRDGPDTCSICGMALRPEMALADITPNAELSDMTRRFVVGLVLAAPVFALDMLGHLAGLHQWRSPQQSYWLQLILATPVVLWAGLPLFERAWALVRSDNLNMFNFTTNKHLAHNLLWKASGKNSLRFMSKAAS